MISHSHRSSLRVRLAHSASAGFTLVEILVVIVIVGVMVAMATLSINVLGRDNEAEEEARRFWAVLQQAREESELQSLNVGLYLAASEYEFLRFDQRLNLWQPITDDKLYATRKLPEGLRFRLWLDSREVVLKPQLPERGDEDDDDDKELSEEEQKEADLPQALRTIERKKPASQENPPQIVVLASGEIMPFEVQIERERLPALWRITALADNDLRVERRGEQDRWDVLIQTRKVQDEKKVPTNARK